MKHTFFLFILIVSGFLSNAQQLDFEFGKVISTFDYNNSENETLQNLEPGTNIHLGLAYKHYFKETAVYMLLQSNYNKYSSLGSNSILDNYYAWDLNYVSTGLGFGYEFLREGSYFNYNNINKNHGFTILLQTSASTDFLVHGTQTINGQIYNLKGVEQFDKPFLFANGTMGLVYYPSKSISVFGSYQYGRGFSVFKSKYQEKEDLNLITHTISFGFSVNLRYQKW